MNLHNKNYLLIDSGTLLRETVGFWQNNGITEIAVDFEGEFNLHCYGEHLCLIQIFDKERFYLVDALKIGGDDLQYFLETSWLKKIWFDCSSDGALVWKNYGIKPANIYDLYLIAKKLHLPGGLAALSGQFCPETAGTPESKSGKKKNQKTNWMKRPLTDEQIAYALSDVACLFDLRDALYNQAVLQHKEKEVDNALKNSLHLKTADTPGFKKIPGYLRMNAAQQTYLQHFFNARDIVAKRCNKPPFMIMDKRDLAKMALAVPCNEFHFKAQAKCRNRQIETMLIPLLMQAKAAAEAELSAQRQNRTSH